MAMKGFAVRPVFGFHDETGPSRVFFSSMKKAVAESCKLSARRQGISKSRVSAINGTP